jgi:hypothetical protein
MSVKKPMSLIKFVLYLIGIPIAGFFVFMLVFMFNLKEVNKFQAKCGIDPIAGAATSTQESCLGMKIMEESPLFLTLLFVIIIAVPVGEGMLFWKYFASRKPPTQPNVSTKPTIDLIDDTAEL